MENNLITSFFTALGSFTKEVIGNKFKTIEMGDVKFVIIQKNVFNYALLCDSTISLIYLENIVSEINTHFFNYITKNHVNINIESVKDETLNEEIDIIIRDKNLNDKQLEEVRAKFSQGLTMADANAIKEVVPGIERVAPQAEKEIEAKYTDKSGKANLTGITPDSKDILK